MTTPCGLLTPADRTDKRAAEATQQEEPMALSNVLCSVLSFFFFFFPSTAVLHSH